jgi:hypothetical protein
MTIGIHWDFKIYYLDFLDPRGHAIDDILGHNARSGLKSKREPVKYLNVGLKI